MLNFATREELLIHITDLGRELRDTAQELNRMFSNYQDMNSEAELAVTALWKGVIDVSDALDNSCHGMPEEAADYYTNKTGFVRIPILTPDDFNNGEHRLKPWHKAKTFRGFDAAFYKCATFSGTDLGEARVETKGELKEKFINPEAMKQARALSGDAGLQETVKVVEVIGTDLRLRRKDGSETGVLTDEYGKFSWPEEGLTKGRLIFTTDDALAPHYPKGTVFAFDNEVCDWDEDGIYIFAAEGCLGDIAEVTRREDGTFDYVSYRDRPEHLDTLAGRKCIGKVRLILKKTSTPELFERERSKVYAMAN